MRPDGTPHPFISYGPGSQYIEHELGVFRCYERQDRPESEVCRLTGCNWEVFRPEYLASTLKRMEESPMPHYAPPVGLKCRDCNVVAWPFKLWEEQPYSIKEEA